MMRQALVGKSTVRGFGLLFVLLSGLSLSGCGYSLVGRATNIPEDIKQVYVSSFENRTTRSQVEQLLTRAIIDELVTRQRFEVLTTPGTGQAEIQGAVIGYGATPVGFDPDGRANEYEISFIAQVIFQRIPTDPEAAPEVLWRNDRYQFRQPYEVPPGAEDYFDQEDQAIEEVAQRFAETMVSDLLEGF